MITKVSHAIAATIGATFIVTLISACRMPTKDDMQIDSLVRTGTVAQVQAVLAQGFDINQRGYRGGTALWWAAIEGRRDMTAFLIAKGADLNSASPDYDTETPLHVAAKKGHREIVTLLLQAGATIDARTELGETPLMQAAHEGKVDVIKLLISHGADVNARTRQGQTALHVPSPRQNRPPGALGQTITELVSHGADVNVQATSPKGYTPLMAVARTGDKDAVEFLLRAGANPNVVDEHGLTALKLAVTLKSEDMRRLLIQYEARE